MTIRTISQLLEDLGATPKGEAVSLDDILEAFHERGFGFFLLIFALPMALPVPVPPGINIALASPLVLLTAQQALGRHTVWMPRSWRRKSISTKKLKTMIASALPWTRRLEIFIKPRMGFITQGRFSSLTGFLGLLMALTVLIPVPLTNTVPSLGIALMAVGVILRDGLTVLAGALIGTAWVAMLAGAVIVLGNEGIDAVKETIAAIF